MDIMLAKPGVDFQGGAFVAPQLDGSCEEPEFRQGDAVFFLSHKVGSGRQAVSQLSFLLPHCMHTHTPHTHTRSHPHPHTHAHTLTPTHTPTHTHTHPLSPPPPPQYHNVRAVTAGTRFVLVAELWEGVEKTCGHRCTTLEACDHAPLWYCDCGFGAEEHRVVAAHEQGCEVARRAQGAGAEGADGAELGD
jgi:hypothetical protein